MTLHQNVLGVDIAKDWIDSFDTASGCSIRIKTEDIETFVRGLSNSLVVFEATGGYERPLADALEAAGIAYARVNPRQAREFARASGRLAKTDKVDARVLAEMGRALELAPTAPRDPGAIRTGGGWANSSPVAKTSSLRSRLKRSVWRWRATPSCAAISAAC